MVFSLWFETLELIDQTSILMSAKRRAAFGGGKWHFSSFFQWRLRRRLDIQVEAMRLGSFIFLFGFMALTAALYFALEKKGNEEVFPSVTIFAAPQPFTVSDGRPDLVGARQELAVRSWLALGPEVTVVLFGRDSSIFYLLGILGPRVTVESDIDFTFMGTPFFHCMVARSQNSSSAISVVVDSETILLPNLLTALRYAYKLDRDWFLVSMTPSISIFPFSIDDTGKHWLKEDGARIRIEKLHEYVNKLLRWSYRGEKLLMAWNTGEVPLYAGILPPFLCGRGFYNSWLLHEVLSSDFRLVVDASYIASVIYPENLTRYFKRNVSTYTSHGSWEVRGNHHLAASYGSLYSVEHDILKIHLKLLKCSGKLVFVDPEKKVVFPHEGYYGHPFGLKVPTHKKHGITFFIRRFFFHLLIEKKWMSCIKDINFLGSQFSLDRIYKNDFTKPVAVVNPFGLESLLKITAHKDKTIVLGIAGENYKDMLMSWVCRLRYLAISNFIVCALDAETNQFALLLGLPVFRDPMAPINISFKSCHFGTDCFQRVTKVKSRIVLQILRLGYNVLLSDVDVYWFKNPLPYLKSFGPAMLVAQSDEYNETGPINLPRRLNSGFYFTRANPPTISAMERVVKHASNSVLSEQPSFYDVLCGEGGINRVDDNHCLEPGTNLTIHFLDRNLFPNGAYMGMWEKRNVRSACKQQGCIVLHNNWISGRKRKLERQVRAGLWEYDPALRMCQRSWHRINLTSHFF